MTTVAQPLMLFDLPIPKFEWNILNPREWIVSEDFELTLFGYDIEIAKSSKSDLASIPRLLKFIYDENGPWTPAALVHDHLYANHIALGISRGLADLIFLILMLVYGVAVRTALIFYESVRLFGWSHWRKSK